MKLEMSDEKQSTGQPTAYVISEPVGGSLKSRLTKKHVLIAVISLLITGLVVTAVLVSVRMFMDNNLEVLKYSMASKDFKQNVSTSENSVIYHVSRDSVEAWIVQNFDTGLQVSKVLVDGKATCYVTALNRSQATDPSSIPTTAPTDNEKSQSQHAVYTVVPEVIPDISFLGKKASDMCKNIPTYHAVPDCDNSAGNPDGHQENGNSSAVDHRNKRAPGWCGTYYTYPRTYQCACGCCGRLCGVFTSNYVWCYYSNGYYNCQFYMSTLYPRYYFSLARSCRYNGVLYYPY